MKFNIHLHIYYIPIMCNNLVNNTIICTFIIGDPFEDNCLPEWIAEEKGWVSLLST